MTQYKVTDSFIEKIAGIPPSEVLFIKEKDHITHKELIKIYNDYKPTSSLIELVRTTKMHIPNKNETQQKPKSKEYIQLMERLRREQKEKEFKDLVSPKQQYETLYDTRDDETISPAQMNKELKSNLTTIVNILISVGSVVYAIWYWTDSSWGLPNSYRVLLCLFFGVLVLVAEVVVYMGYINKIEAARTKEKNKKEIKKVIKTL